MRKAAGVLLIVGAIASAYPVFVFTVDRYSPVFVFVGLAILVGLIIGGGISAIRKKAYWWACAAAICVMLVGIIFGFWEWHSLLIMARRLDLVTRVLYAILAGLFGVPGVLALIFLVKRRGEFQS